MGLILVFLITWTALANLANGALTWKTHDISSLLLEEAAHVTYKDLNGNTAKLETIVKNGGANNIKIRLFVNPSDGNYNLAYGIKLGLRAKAAGLSVSLNVHYSDTWANPGQQNKPSAWAGLSTSALISQVQSYTTSVLNEFYKNGIDVNLVGIGNEIRGGILWPTGKYDQMANLAKLLTAASQGVRSSNYGSKAKVMIHLDRGYSWGDQQWFYDSIISAGFNMNSVDVQGVSYYPFWDSVQSTLTNFQTCINNMASKYKKSIILVETGWPLKCSKASSNIPSSLTSTIPFSADGQVAWVQKVAWYVNNVPNGLGKGVMYWEPGWIDNSVLGSPCEDGGVLFTGDYSQYPNDVAWARTSINMFNTF